MAEDIWEKSKYKVKATVVDDSKPYSGKVDLFVLKDGDEANPIKSEKDISVSPGKAIERTFDVPVVPDDKPTYQFSVIVKYGDSKEKTQQLADAVVWPKEVEFHAVNLNEDKKDFKNVKLEVVQNGKAISRPLTDAAGKCKVELTRKEPYSFDLRSPFEISNDKTQASKLRKHELEVIRHIVPTFIAPNVKKSKPWVAADGDNTEANRLTAVKLWVNQTSKAGNGADANGHVVEFEVCAKPKGDGKKDDRVYVQVRFSRDSDRNDPPPKVLDAPEVLDLSESQAGPVTVFRGYVKLDKDGGSAKFKVDTGLAGGDTCSVIIAGREFGFDENVKLTNWRRLWYELRGPSLLKPKMHKGDYSVGLKQAVDNKLKVGFVSFELAKSHSFSDSSATIKKKNGMIMPKTFFKDNSGGDIYVVTNGWLDTTDKFSGDAKKRQQTVYVSLCERSFSSNVTSKTYAPNATSAEHSFYLGTCVFPKKTNTGADNLVVSPGFKWKAVVAGPHPQATELVLAAGGPATAGSSPGHVTLTETKRPGKSVTVSFDAVGGGFAADLSAPEKAKVDTFIAGLLGSDPELRDVGNKVNLKFTSRGDATGTRLQQVVQQVAQDKFTAVSKSVNFHPGLDRNGVAREGPMNVVWLSVKTYQEVTVTLPTSPDGTAAHLRILPGDFVGAAETDAECPVTVQFSCHVGGEINGNSGDGSQIMVLRDVPDGALSETVCHELGHSMGMSVVPGLENDLLPPGLTTKHVDNGGTSYVNGDGPYALTDGKREIHKGGHCAFSIPDDKRADKAFLDWSPTAGCIMWGSGGDVETRTMYCPECLKILKARRLEDIKKAFVGRGATQG